MTAPVRVYNLCGVWTWACDDHGNQRYHRSHAAALEAALTHIAETPDHHRIAMPHNAPIRCANCGADYRHGPADERAVTPDTGTCPACLEDELRDILADVGRILHDAHGTLPADLEAIATTLAEWAEADR